MSSYKNQILIVIIIVVFVLFVLSFCQKINLNNRFINILIIILLLLKYDIVPRTIAEKRIENKLILTVLYKKYFDNYIIIIENMILCRARFRRNYNNPINFNLFIIKFIHILISGQN